MLRTPEQVALGLARAYRGLELRDGLPRVATLTLVIGAEGDASTPELRSREIARPIPGARLAIVKGAGHFVQLERPNEVNQAIREFLLEHGL